MRGINQKFIDDLKFGELSFFLKQVQENRDLFSLEVRNGYINIYYRGGNLLKITQKKNGYTFHFDIKYCLEKNDVYAKLCSLDLSSAPDYTSVFGLMKEEMNKWFVVHPKREREYQHNLLSRNPSIMDIEYQINYKNTDGKAKAMRLDMIALVDDKIIIVESKYGEGAVSGSAGMTKHYSDICMVLENEKLRSELITSMQNIADAKCRLGLFEYHIPKLDIQKTEILFLFASYNTRSKTIDNEIADMEVSFPARILFTKEDEYVIDYKKSKDLFAYGS